MMNEGFYTESDGDVVKKAVAVTNSGAIHSCITDENGQSPAVSVFGDLMVGQRHPDIIAKFAHGLSDREVITTAIANGTTSTANGLLTINSGEAINSSMEVKSKDTVRYLSGFGMYAMFTAAFVGTGVVGSERSIGFSNGNDGVLIVNDAGVMKLRHIRANGSTVSEVAQESWIDRLDGQGASGINVDWTKINIFRITLGHLGVAPIVFWIHNGKKFIPFHSFEFANNTVLPHLINPYLKIIAKCANTTNNTNLSLLTASWNAGSMHGAGIDVGSSNRRFNAEASITSIITERPVFSIKNKANYPTGELENFVKINLVNIKGVCEGNGSNVIKFKLYRNATLSAGTTTYTDEDNVNSCAQFNTGATAFTGGTLIWSDACARNVQVKFDLEIEKIELYPNETLTLTATSASGVNFDASITWIEAH